MKRLKYAVATALLSITGAAHAQLQWNLTYTAATTAAAQANFIAATNFWSSVFTDNVTLNLTVGLDALGTGVLGSTASTRGTVSFANFRTVLAADATSAADQQAVASLGSAASFGMLINRTANNPNGAGSATAYVDNNGDANNSTIRLTTANAKAAGFVVSPATSDGSVRFATGFLSSFDFDRSDGITAGQFDFLGIAIHEIGHALGFVSGVDTLDINSPPVNGPFNDNEFTFLAPLDLFRYSSASTEAGVIDWTASTTDKYFSLDGGATKIASFSTGRNFGDGQQNSHWKDSLGLGIMDPTAARGELLAVSTLDRTAFDVIGWNLATPVPEPSTYALLGIGLAAIGVMRRRKAAAAR